MNVKLVDFLIPKLVQQTFNMFSYLLATSYLLALDPLNISTIPVLYRLTLIGETTALISFYKPSFPLPTESLGINHPFYQNVFLMSLLHIRFFFPYFCTVPSKTVFLIFTEK